MSEHPNRRPLGRSFRQVWLSVIVSSTGDGMFITAFPLLAATLTSNPVLIAGITIASRLPWLLFSMVTGAIADRMDRRRLMIGADLVRCVIVGVLGVLILAGAASIWLLYLCAFLLGTGETLHTNSAQAMLPAIVAPPDLLQANARFGAAQVAAAQFVGPPLGSVCFDAARSLPFLADAISFAGSAALIRGLPDVHGVDAPTTRLRDDVREGLRYLRHNAAMRRLTAILALINFFYFAATSLLVLYNRDLLHAGEYTYTALFVGAATGTVLSRFVVHALTARIGVTRTIAAAMWLWALSIGGLALTSTRLVAIAMFVLLGLGTGLWLTLNTTLRQQLTPARLLGRMNAAYRTVSWGVVPFGAAFGGIVAKWWGLRAPFAIGAVVMGLIALSSPVVLRPVRTAVAALAAR